MILQKNHSDQYLEDVINGKIKKGLAIGSPRLDEYIRYNQGEFTIINGLDNVGKTAWMLWYFLAMAIKHNKKFCIYSGENKASRLVKQLIEYYNDRKITETDPKKVYAAKGFIDDHFTFISNENFYKLDDLLQMFEISEADACLIDPYTALDREFTYAGNYNFLNTSRHFVNNTNISLYVNTHPNTEAARSFYTDKDGEGLLGYNKPPQRSQSEGGQGFANRPDNYWTIHRLVGHPEYGLETHVYSRKVKDTDLGGKVSAIDDPIRFEYNYGCGFLEDGHINPLK